MLLEYCFIFCIYKVAGSVLAAFIGFGVPANHLLVASVMSAPAALAVAKLMYPETKKTKASWDRIRNLPKLYVKVCLKVFCL